MRFTDYMDSEMPETLRPAVQASNRQERLRDAWDRYWVVGALLLGLALLVAIWMREDPQRDKLAGYENAETLLAREVGR